MLFNNARQKQENQIKAIRGFISQRVDYIVFSPVTEDGWETVLQEAKEAKIPVILVDRTISEAQQDLSEAAAFQSPQGREIPDVLLWQHLYLCKDLLFSP